jgi:hypothetical protein
MSETVREIFLLLILPDVRLCLVGFDICLANISLFYSVMDYIGLLKTNCKNVLVNFYVIFYTRNLYHMRDVI